MAIIFHEMRTVTPQVIWAAFFAGTRAQKPRPMPLRVKGGSKGMMLAAPETDCGLVNN